jgi:Cytochrome oxidase complex assembly protein 1
MPPPLIIQVLAVALLVMAACSTVRGPADLGRGRDADALSRAALQADAMARVQASLPARAVLGDRVAAGEPARGDVVARGPGGHAVLTVPVAGTRGRGRIHAVAQRSREAWRFSRLVLAVDGADRLDLSPSPPAEPLALPPPESRV